jgi:hypothetical protein
MQVFVERKFLQVLAQRYGDNTNGGDDNGDYGDRSNLSLLLYLRRNFHVFAHLCVVGGLQVVVVDDCKVYQIDLPLLLVP